MQVLFGKGKTGFLKSDSYFAKKTILFASVKAL